MNVIVPDYYKDFECIADRCRHSCCIGWEIDIDDVTLSHYESIKGDFGKRLKENISLEDTPHFRLTEDERCPFLDECGLCDIIKTLGKDALCQICDDHPRFKNYYPDRTEIGLGLCCEAAAELILGKKEKTYLVGSIKSDTFTAFRDRIFSILQDRSVPLDKRADKMLSLCGGEFPHKTADEWRDIYLSLERLDDEWENCLNIISDFSFSDGNDVPYEQLLVYFIYRHLTPDCDLSKTAVFAVLSYRIIRAIAGDSFEKLLNVARMYSSEIEYSDENADILIKKYC